MSSESKLYPDLDCIEITEDEQRNLQEAARAEGKAEARIEYIKDKQRQLKARLEHLSKLKHRWTITKHVSEGVGVTVTVICAVLTIFATTGIIAVPVLALATTGTGLMTPLLQALTNRTFITKHRNKIKIKHTKTKELIDKLFVHFDKCVSDNIITDSEMKQIEQILQTPLGNQRSQLGQQQQLNPELTKVLIDLLTKLR